jgi:hypothetical protein
MCCSGQFRFVEQAGSAICPRVGVRRCCVTPAQMMPGLGLLFDVRSFCAARLCCVSSTASRRSSRCPDQKLAEPTTSPISPWPSRARPPGPSTPGRWRNTSSATLIGHPFVYAQPRRPRPDEVFPACALRPGGPVPHPRAGRAGGLRARRGPSRRLSISTCRAGEGRALACRPVKGNYYHGQVLDALIPLRVGLVRAGPAGGRAGSVPPGYRRFFLEEVCEIRESRRPNIYYNTWNYQERQKYFKDRPFLESMTAERMLAEIDVAHRWGSMSSSSIPAGISRPATGCPTWKNSPRG